VKQTVAVCTSFNNGLIQLHFRFDDASYYYWILSVQFADLAREGDQPEEMIAKFYEYQQKASIYYAYHTIQR
jgi:intraflagellar transport protein 122